MRVCGDECCAVFAAGKCVVFPHSICWEIVHQGGNRRALTGFRPSWLLVHAEKDTLGRGLGRFRSAGLTRGTGCARGAGEKAGPARVGRAAHNGGHVVGNDPCAPSRASIPYEPSPRRAQEAKGRGVRNLCSARHAPSHQVLEGAELGQCRCSGGVSGSPSVSESKGSRSSVESRWEACSCLQTSPNGLGVVG